MKWGTRDTGLDLSWIKPSICRVSIFFVCHVICARRAASPALLVYPAGPLYSPAYVRGRGRCDDAWRTAHNGGGTSKHRSPRAQRQARTARHGPVGAESALARVDAYDSPRPRDPSAVCSNSKGAVTQQASDGAGSSRRPACARAPQRPANRPANYEVWCAHDAGAPRRASSYYWLDTLANPIWGRKLGAAHFSTKMRFLRLIHGHYNRYFTICICFAVSAPTTSTMFDRGMKQVITAVPMWIVLPRGIDNEDACSATARCIALLLMRVNDASPKASNQRGRCIVGPPSGGA
ncbi:hypothetical protein B0H13DRAFT_2288167 [Mycena leptocephala]|nr:hypothetical protein B0H13DRAFT_2288167 [Mycena leptocephala]